MLCIVEEVETLTRAFGTVVLGTMFFAPAKTLMMLQTTARVGCPSVVPPVIVFNIDGRQFATRVLIVPEVSERWQTVLGFSACGRDEEDRSHGGVSVAIRLHPV